MKEKPSPLTFTYDSQKNEWATGPPLLTARSNHSSCAIKSEDGATQGIIVIGGKGYCKDYPLISTEILRTTEQKWTQGPDLPMGIAEASCIELPSSMNYVCLIIGGTTTSSISLASMTIHFNNPSSLVYGLDKSLSTWIPLGKISERSGGLLALAFS